MSEVRTGRLIVEDSDLAYLVLDPSGLSSEDGPIVNIEIAAGVEDWADEDESLWLFHETTESYTVVPRASFDYDADLATVGYPIPTPEIISDQAELKQRRSE